MDLDGDGRKDMVSGSWPGELHLFVRKEDGAFAAARILTNRGGTGINVGSASAVFAADWDLDGDLDLLVGNIDGEVHLVANESGDTKHSFAERTTVLVFGVPGGDAGPCVADWDGDGRHDLLVGAGDGSVLLYRNASSTTEGMPVLAAPVRLVAPSADDGRSPGSRAKVCVADWNGDGLLDLLVGDLSSSIDAPPTLTEEQERERNRLQKRQDELSVRLDAVLDRVRESMSEDDRLHVAKRNEALRRDQDFEALQKELGEVWEALSPLVAQPAWHGWVWVFLRKGRAI